MTTGESSTPESYEAYNVRPATRTDATTLAHIELQAQFARGVQLTNEQYHSEALRISKLLQSEATWSGVAQAKNEDMEPVGFIFGYPRTKEGLPHHHHLDTLMVLPSHWRRGIAAHLIDLALLDAARQDVASINLWTDTDNESARPLYEGKGFTLTGETRTHPWLPKEQVEYSVPTWSLTIGCSIHEPSP